MNSSYDLKYGKGSEKESEGKVSTGESSRTGLVFRIVNVTLFFLFFDI